jgi:hypothetical protein
MYMMVSGDRTELRGLNLEGLRHCGFSDPEVRKFIVGVPYYVNSGAWLSYSSKILELHSRGYFLIQLDGRSRAYDRHSKSFSWIVTRKQEVLKTDLLLWYVHDISQSLAAIGNYVGTQSQKDSMQTAPWLSS